MYVQDTMVAQSIGMAHGGKLEKASYMVGKGPSRQCNQQSRYITRKIKEHLKHSGLEVEVGRATLEREQVTRKKRLSEDFRHAHLYSCMENDYLKPDLSYTSFPNCDGPAVRSPWTQIRNI